MSGFMVERLLTLAGIALAVWAVPVLMLWLAGRRHWVWLAVGLLAVALPWGYAGIGGDHAWGRRGGGPVDLEDAVLSLLFLPASVVLVVLDGLLEMRMWPGALMALGLLIGGVLVLRKLSVGPRIVALPVLAILLWEVPVALQGAIFAQRQEERAEALGLEITELRSFRDSWVAYGMFGGSRARHGTAEGDGGHWVWSYREVDWVRWY
ncbi:hypothetical protein [Sagittula sp. S175]|uniref:hypothetical protein n=1 Tax=Sagittula sp. S175 TaxID=3415129 RepID=UPI003C7E8AF2